MDLARCSSGRGTRSAQGPAVEDPHSRRRPDQGEPRGVIHVGQRESHDRENRDGEVDRSAESSGWRRGWRGGREPLRECGDALVDLRSGQATNRFIFVSGQKTSPFHEQLVSVARPVSRSCERAEVLDLDHVDGIHVVVREVRAESGAGLLLSCLRLLELPTVAPELALDLFELALFGP